MLFEDVETLKPVGGTPAGRYYEVAPDVVLAIPRPSYRQTVDGAKASLAELDRIAREAGRRQALIVVIDRVVSQDAASRRVWAQPRERETRCAQALVCGNALARAIGSFFLGLNRSAVPTRMFERLEDAIAWTQELVQQHGGPLE